MNSSQELSGSFSSSSFCSSFSSMSSLSSSELFGSLTSSNRGEEIQEFRAQDVAESITDHVMLELFTEIIPAITVASESLKQIMDPRLVKNLKERPLFYIVGNRSGEFVSHFELRLQVMKCKIRLICLKNEEQVPERRIHAFFFHLMKSEPFAEGTMKTLRFGCLVVRKGKKLKAKVIADGREDYSEKSIIEESCFEMLKNVAGIAKLYRALRIYRWSDKPGSYQLFLMKYYPKKTLLHVFLEEKLSEEKQFAIVFSLFDILQQVHQHGISHNDFKMENILMDQKMRPFLADFSLSFLPDFSSQPVNGVAGSIGYLPTEICSAERSREFRAIDALMQRWDEEQRAEELQGLSYEELEHSYKQLHREIYNTIYANINKGMQMVPMKNDICALGFIIEDLFGREYHPKMEALIDGLTCSKPDERLSLEEGKTFLREVHQIKFPPQNQRSSV